MPEIEDIRRGFSLFRRAKKLGKAIRSRVVSAPLEEKANLPGTKAAGLLSARGRDQISEGNFALPGRRYPIHDESHARNALARVAQHGTSGEKAQVEAAVKNKFPGIGQEKQSGFNPEEWASKIRNAPSWRLAEIERDAKKISHPQAQGMVGRLLSEERGFAARAAKAVVKKASLCEKIAGTLNESDFARFNEVFTDPRARELVEKNATVVECLHRLTAKPIMPAEKLAEAALNKVAQPRFNVIQVRPDGYGYIVKVSGAPKDVAPKETKVTPEKAKETLPEEALQTADEQGVATMTDVQAEPDPMQEPPPEQVTQFGMYKVFEVGTGKQIIGYVIPGLFDPRAGGPSAMSAFINGGQYALQPAIVGNLVGVNFNLPESANARGLGLFYKTDGKGLVATVPYNIISEVTVEGCKYLSAQDPNTGEELQLTISEGLMKPLVGPEGEVVIPSDYHFLALDNPIELEGAPEADPMAGAKMAALPSMMEVRAWEGGCRLDGPVFEKIGSGEHSWVDGLFWMAATGVPQNLGVALLDKAASSGQPIRLFGLQPLSPLEERVKEAADEAYEDFKNLKIPNRHCLLKEAAALSFDKAAAALVGTDSIDAVLALNFVNPENIESFVDNLPQLESASAKLASLVLATQIGLQSVPKEAAIKAMNALEEVIEGLKGLKTYRI